MKYIKNYKNYFINESSTYEKDDLIVDDNVVEEYFEQHYKVDEEEYIYSGVYLINFINETEFMDSVIYDEANYMDVSEYSDEDLFYEYIEKSLKEKHTDEETIDEYIIDEIDEGLDKDLDINDKLEIFNLEQLQQFVVDYLDKYDFVNFAAHKKYDDMSVQEYLSEIYREENYYNALQYYINYEELDKDIINDSDYDTKLELYYDALIEDDRLQNDLYNYDNKNIIYLFDIIPDGSFFGEDPNYQLNYIVEYKKEHTTIYDTTQEQDEEWEDILNICLTLIDKKFGLSDNIIKKYPKETRKLVTKKQANKFNL